MNKVRMFGSLVLLASVTSPALAQLVLLGQTPVDSANSPVTGFDLSSGYALVSLQPDGRQVVIDVSNPASPFACPPPAFNPPYGDIFAEPLVFGGADQGLPGIGPYLFTGHRFGGLNMIDALTPCSQLASIDSTWTQYSHEGLDAISTPTGQYLVYGEHPASSTAGGIRIYDITNGSLNEVGSVLNPGGFALDGGDVLFAAGGNLVFQYSPLGRIGLTQSTLFLVYDTLRKDSPRLLSQVDVPGVTPHFSAELVHDESTATVYVSTGIEGLVGIDVANPLAPTAQTLLQYPGLNVLDLAMYMPGVLLVGGYMTGGADRSYVIPVLITDPLRPVILWDYLIKIEGLLRDIKVRDGKLYTLFWSGSTGQNGLQIWG